MSATVPDRIGKYPISAVLGRGAMGVVYKGFDPHIQRVVAIKTIHKELLGDEQAHAEIAARFRNEAQAVGRLQHPGIVAIYEFGQDESCAYIAMEFVEGRGLDQVLAGTPLLAEPQALQIMDQLLAALDCAHQAGVWHRDIKPANLLLTHGGQIKLTDFGIARIENAGLTQVASMIGTPGYMAPEQYVGEGVDQRADLFAAGVLLYRLLTGSPPFAGSAETVMYKIMNEQPRPPSQVSPRPLAGSYDALLEKALAKTAAGRFQSATAFRQALRQAVARQQAAGGQPPLEAADDATVIVAPGHWARAAEAGTPQSGSQAGSQAGSAAGSAAFAGVPAGGAAVEFPPTAMATAMVPSNWDLAALSRIERALATHVGPMAKLMVRQAARDCADLGSLASQVAQHIAQEPQRQRFITEALAGSQATPLGSQARTLSGAGTGTGTRLGSGPGTGSGAAAAPSLAQADPVTEAFKAHALTVLSRHLGPIAKIVLKRAVDKAQTRNQLIQLLLESAGDIDLGKLQIELRTGP